MSSISVEYFVITNYWQLQSNSCLNSEGVFKKPYRKYHDEQSYTILKVCFIAFDRNSIANRYFHTSLLFSLGILY